jgi:hypothetical protein
MRPREADGTMIIESGLRGSRPNPGADAITSERRQLINLACRLLGSLTEAEDAVQKAPARSKIDSCQVPGTSQQWRINHGCTTHG